MSDEWYFMREGRRHGPVSWERLLLLAQNGQVASHDLVWREGMSEWTPLHSIHERRAAVPPPPSPPAAPVASAAVSASPPFSPRRTKAGPLVFVLAVLGAALAGWAGHWVMTPDTKPTGDVTRSDDEARVAARKERATAAPRNPKASERPSSPPGEPKQKQRPLDRPTKEASAGSPSTLPPSAAAEPPETNAPPSASPAPSSPIPPADDEESETLFQEVAVFRRPAFVVQGLTINQELKYRVLSKLTISSRRPDGARRVRQQVYDAKLEKSDDLSRAVFQQALRRLPGQEFTYLVKESGEVADFKGAKDGKKTVPVQGFSGQAFLVASVMDPDGWKELAQLSFFTPPDSPGRGASFDRAMNHDWGPLGSWYGKTTYNIKSSDDEGQRIEYTHKMTYVPPGKNAGALPFTVTAAQFKTLQAGGIIHFDARSNRVHSAQEHFHAQGVVETRLLGQASRVLVEEQQLFSVRLVVKNPWADK